MFDLIQYAKEQLAIRGLKAQYMAYKTIEFPDTSWLLELDAWNGIIFFQHPFDLPVGTLITGDNNAIEVNTRLTNEKAPNMIEEFCGQVIVELKSEPENSSIVQYLQVYLA
jgi:hypothetical protein